MPDEHIAIQITADTTQLPRAVADIAQVEAAINRLIASIQKLNTMPITVNVPQTAMGGVVPGAQPAGGAVPAPVAQQVVAAGAAATTAGAAAGAAAPGFINLGTGMGQTAGASNRLRTSFTLTENATRGIITQTASVSEKIAGVGTVTERLTTVTGRGTSAFANMGRQLAGIATGMLVWRGVTFVTETIEEMIDAQARYSVEVARFGAVTQQSVGQATAAYRELQSTLAAVGFGPQAAAPAITLAGQFTKARDEQKLLVSESGDLALLLGIEPARAMDVLITGIRQGKLEIADVGRLGDVVADAFGKIPATGAEIAQALEESIPLAAQLGITLEEAFTLVIQAATVASDSPNKIANALQTVAKGLTDIRSGSADAFERMQALSKQGIELRIGREWREIPDILQDVGQAITRLQGTEGGAVAIQRILEAVTGAEIRPERMRSLIAVFTELATGIPRASSDLVGALDRATEDLKNAFGTQLATLDAQIVALQQRGDILQNVWAQVLRAAAPLGGIQGVRAAQQAIPAAPTGQESLTMFGGLGLGRNVISGAARAIVEQYYDQLTQFSAEQRREFVRKLSADIRTAFLAPEVQRQIEEIPFVAPEARRQQMQRLQPVTGPERLRREYGITEPTIAPELDLTGAGAEVDALLAKFRLGIEGLAPGVDTALFPEAIDATKFSMEEIAAARTEAAAMAEAELQAQIAFLQALGLSNEEIQEYIDHQREVLDLTIQVARTQEGIEIFRGAEAKFLPEALRQQQEAGRRKESDFAFRRLRDVEPAQFGQLQALMAMYDRMLTQLGSPEEPRRINVMLGQEGVLRVLTGRMSALQLALEDLTKVEKAQLSGTWNLPAGATALVPISSLDIQRWNAGQGGPNIDWDALLNAEMQGSDQVTGAIDKSTQAIVSAILKGDTTFEEGLRTAKKPEEAALGVALMAIIGAVLPGIVTNIRMRQPAIPEERPDRFRAPRPGFGGRQQEFVEARAGREQLTSVLDFIESRFRQPLGVGGGRLGAGLGGDGPDGRRPTVTPTVTVNPTPIRAQFTANINVMMNGQVLARAIYNMIYQQILRLTRSGPGSSTTRTLGIVK